MKIIEEPCNNAPSKKKSVSFKATLETSDDKSVVKKVYNPDNAPLVPIIKRKCLNRLNGLGKSTCIVRPSRLTDVLKNNESSTTIIKASLFSSLSSASSSVLSNGDRLSGLTSKLESPRKSLLSCRIIKSSKKSLAGYPRELLKKLRKSIDGKTRHVQFSSEEAPPIGNSHSQDGQGRNLHSIYLVLLLFSFYINSIVCVCVCVCVWFSYFIWYNVINDDGWAEFVHVCWRI